MTFQPKKNSKILHQEKTWQALQNKSMLTLALGPGDVSIMSMPEEPGITWMKYKGSALKKIRSQVLHLGFDVEIWPGG